MFVPFSCALFAVSFLSLSLSLVCVCVCASLFLHPSFAGLVCWESDIGACLLMPLLQTQWLHQEGITITPLPLPCGPPRAG